MKNSLKFRIEVRGQAWAVVDQSNPAISFPFDQAVVDATLITETAVEGYITSIHGLSQELADLCDGPLLHALGVGAQLRSQQPVRCVRALGRTRVRLVAHGEIERIGHE